MLNNTGERPHPCLTPLFMCIGSDLQSLKSLYVMNTNRMPCLKIASDKYSNHLLRKPNSLLEEYWA